MGRSRFHAVAGFVENFWRQVNKKGPRMNHMRTCCWVWTGSIGGPGYGQVQARKISRMPMTTHRIAWEMKHGKNPGEMHVLHHCDNRACVRASHLFLGTQHDNILDRCQKGRTASGDKNGARTQPKRNPFVRNGGSGLKGDKHPMAKLTDVQTAELRRRLMTGENRQALAEEFGLSVLYVYQVACKEKKCLSSTQTRNSKRQRLQELRK